jgi:hypothetical protein
MNDGDDDGGGGIGGCELSLGVSGLGDAEASVSRPINSGFLLSFPTLNMLFHREIDSHLPSLENLRRNLCGDKKFLSIPVYVCRKLEETL